MKTINIVILYYSKHGSTRALAEAIARGAEQMGANVKVRTVPPVSDNLQDTKSSVPEKGHPYISKYDIEECDGLALGSPTHFGNMAAPMKYFWDTTTDLWLRGSLVDKPACVFSSSSSMHGGQESTLLSMMLPLFHHGMLLLGLPYSEPSLHETKSGGTPYGVTSVAESGGSINKLSDDELSLAISMGRRLASTSQLQVRMKD